MVSEGTDGVIIFLGLINFARAEMKFESTTLSHPLFFWLRHVQSSHSEPENGGANMQHCSIAVLHNVYGTGGNVSLSATIETGAAHTQEGKVIKQKVLRSQGSALAPSHHLLLQWCPIQCWACYK